MKMRMQMMCFAIIVFLAVVPGFAQQTYKFQIPADNEPFYGTWVNTEYAGTTWKTRQKFVYNSWGDAEAFKKASDEKAVSTFNFILVEKWADAKGNTWYKELEQAKGVRNFGLCRISKDGKTLEQIFRSAGFPAESDMGPSYPNYYLFHRQ
jgi:hypothetical protein